MNGLARSLAVLILVTFSGGANAVLESRLGGLAYYDTQTNLTWLTDANAAGTQLNWADAKSWAQNLSVAGVSGWRLPATLQPDASCEFQAVYSHGYLCTGSEMGGLYYNTLGNSGDILTNSGPFINIQSYYYWSGTAFVDDNTKAWYFAIFNGYQNIFDITNGKYAWAVQTGDVGEVAGPNVAPTAIAQIINMNEDALASIVLTGSDVNGDILTYSVSTQPGNGVLSGETPYLVYTPNANFTGTDSFSFVANDGLLNSAIETITISVLAVNDAPVGIIQNITTAEETAVSVLLSGTDIEGDALTYSVTTQPTNGVLTGVVPNLTYTPNVNFNGADSFVFVANDGVVNSATVTISITVTGTNDVPVATAQSIATNEDTAAGIVLSGADIDGDALTYSVTTQPVNGVLSGVAPNLTYTPNVNFNGVDSFGFIVNDGVANSATATISITVASINDVPVATAQSIATTEETAISVSLSGTDIDGDTLTYSVTIQPANGVLTGVAPNLTYTPNANFNSADSFGFIANDGVTNSTVATISITIAGTNDVPVTTAQSITTDEDIATSIVLSGTDLDGDVLTYSVTTQPVNGVLSGVAPNLTYTPNINFNGTDSFSFVANDGVANSAAATISITIAGTNDVPVAITQNITTAEETAASVSLSGTDIDGDTLTYSVTTQPTDGILMGVAPNLTYTPNANFNGADSFGFIVNDGVANSATTTISITVTSTNDVPVATAQSIATNEDTAASIVLSGTDIDGDTLTYSVTTQPVNGVLSGIAPNLTYTPNVNFNGIDSFSFVANDGVVNSANAIIYITVTGVNDVPVATAQTIATNEGTAAGIVLSGSDLDGDALTYNVTAQPVNGVLTGVAPNLTYTPNVDFNGADSFSFVANDGVINSATAIVSIMVVTVTGANDVPVATAQSILTNEDTAAGIILSAIDTDGDALTYSVTTQPANGVLTGVAPNLTYTPNVNFNGTDSFSFVANDGTLNSVAAVISINVSAANDAPIANEQFISLNEDSAIAITLTGSDLDGDALTYQLVQSPTNGVITGTPPNLTYTPAANFNGIDELYFTVSDGTATSANTLVDINVLAVNDVPVADTQSVITDENISALITLSGSDTEGDVLNYEVMSQPANGVLIGTAPALTYTPNTNYYGVDSFDFRVNDGTDNSQLVTVNITVNSVNVAPVANAQAIITDVSTAAPITLSASDGDNDVLTYQIISAPVNGVLTGNAPNLIYTPNLNYTGSDSFTFNVNDGALDSGIVTVDITVNGVNEPPVILSNPVLFAIENQPYTYQLQLSDPNNDQLTVSMSSNAMGAIFDTVTGAVKWDAPVLGSYSVTLTVTDPDGLSVQQSYTLQVLPQQSDVTTRGTDFWLTYLLNHGSNNNGGLKIFVSSDVGANFTVEIPGLSYTVEYSVAANSVTTIDVTNIQGPDGSNMMPAYGMLKNAIHIIADAPVYVVAANLSKATSDASIVYPTAALGTQHQVLSWALQPSQLQGNANFRNEAAVVATVDNTVVTILPTVEVLDDIAQTNNKLAGISFDVQLNRGEVYQFATPGGGSELSGTTISANYPVAVFSGELCMQTGAPACDHVYEQVPAINNWASEYLILPLANKVGGDIIRIYAAHDDTHVWVEDDIVAGMAKGEFYETVVLSPTKIRSTKPVAVTQFETSRGSSANGDPSMTVVTPVEQYVSSVSFTTDINNYLYNYVNIITHSSALAAVNLDGVPVDNNGWVQISDTEYYGQQITLNAGIHNVSSDGDMGVFVYGRDPVYNFESYAYTGGMSFANNRQATALHLSVSDLTPVTGGELCISAQAVDVNDLPVTHTQVTFFRQVGANFRSYTDLTDKTGKAEICYTAGEAGIENFNVNIQSITEALSVNWSAYGGADNRAPVILSLPVMNAIPNQPYQYQVIANDPNQDALQYELTESPFGMDIDMFTGEVTWLTSNSFEETWVTVEVTDAQGATTRQRYRLINEPGSNRYPNFTSTSETRLMTGRLYSYVMTSSDMDNVAYVDSKTDLPTYSIVTAPPGIALVNDSRGELNTLSWTPTEADIGSHEVTVQVIDTQGAYTQQAFVLTVELNLPPQFITQPVTSAIAAHTYTYAFTAVDENSDTLTYSVLEAPIGMTFEPATPYVTWTPGTVQAGAHRVVVQADDTFGGIITQEFTITVAANQAPVFTEQPLQIAKTGFNYKYRIQVADPDGDSLLLKYALISRPEGMTLVNDISGAELRWIPTLNQTGVHQAVIEVNDGFGAWVTYSFEIRVEQNQAPTITSAPVTSGITGHPYVYIPTATDPESGASRTLSRVTGPVGMTMNTAGQLTWTPTDLQFGNHLVTIQATDAQGAFTRQTYQLAISKNAAPVFTSFPDSGVKVGDLWQYYSTATDEDNDGVVFRLISGPETIYSGITGSMNWRPTIDDVGTHAVSIEAYDNRGGVTPLVFNITVIDTALAFTSYPNNPIIFNDELYNFNLQALHPDDLSLTYALTQRPTDLTVNAATGELSWTPTSTQIGVHNVSATVTDGLGQTDTASFTIQVSENTNQAPVIESQPITSALIDTQYAYAVIATDAENHVITYSLNPLPNGMAINAVTGLITWTPTAADVGDHAVTVRATDERTRFTEQSFIVTVQPANQKPVINGIPAISAAVGYEYHQTLAVTDPDGDALNFVALSPPAGLSVDPVTGNVTWIPVVNQVGEHIVSIQIDDGEAFISVSWTITVSDVLVPIELFVNAQPQFIQQGEVSTLTVISNGGIAQAEVSVLVDGLPVALDRQGQAILDGSIIGRHNVDVTSTDGVNTESYSTYYSVADPTDTTPPTVEIISPAGGASITAPTDITVTVADNNLAEVLLAYTRAGSEDHVELYKGTDLFTNQVIATFDPTQLMNGLYHIVLQATDVNGQISNTAIPVVVEGDLKVGNFSITLEDINIPLAGIPVRVTRTYDSRQRSEQLDFGYGWSIDYQNAKVEESNEPTDGWYQETRNLLFQIDSGSVSFAATCTYPLSGKLVTVTLPNGDVEKFSVHAAPANGTQASVADPDCRMLADRFFELEFTAEPGTNSTLSSIDAQGLYLTDTTGGNLSSIGDTAPLPITRYTLTTREGYIYNLNQNFGIETIADPNGNTLTYSDTGITHSGGKSIDFNRDRDGRILTITDASGTLVTYEYNALGDLTSSTDALTNATTYSYAEGHALEEIVDPLGRRLVRNIYDLDGRLIAQEDSDGNRTDFNHDVAGRLSVVTNRRGFATQYAYDDRGNVLTEIDALANTTQYTFDANDNQLSKTDALANITTATYNAEDDQLTQTDALGNTVSFSYNTRGQELTITDAKLNVFTNSYDTYGNLLTITDPAGNVASNVIGNYGLPASVTNTLGYLTSYTYDVNGNKLTETDALGNLSTYTYDDNNNVLSEARTRTVNGTVVTETTAYTYDELDRLLTTTNALNETTSQEYDAVGNKVRDIDAQGRITEYTYDAYRRITQTTYPDASFSSKTYDAEGNLLTETDRTANVTNYVYDALNRLESTTYADGTSMQIEYDALGRVIAEIDANNNRTEFVYDAAGRRTLTRDALLNETTFTYDEEGNLISQTDANTNTTTFEYDTLDNRISTTYPDASISSQTYDAMGQVLSRTDQSGIATNYAYDALGRLSQVTDALLGITAYSYDEVGNKLTQTDAELRTTSWIYDALGREITRTLPLQQSDSSSYDVHGNLQSHTDFNGQITSYVYDDNNRVTRIDYNDLTAETFTYDNEGRRTSATDRQGNTQSWAYDTRGRLTLDTKANGDQISYSYDNAGNRTAITLTPFNGSAAVTTYGFDTLNRLDTVTAPGALVTSYTYDNVGNRASVTYPNANVTSYVYDTLNRLTQQSTTSGVTTLTDFVYGLDASGHRTQITEASGRVTDYTYDDLYRLLTENITDATNGNYSATYIYDKVGNRTYSTINAVQTQFTYDDNDRLTQQGGTVYTYDANGNTLTETLDLNTKTFSYDAKNQLTGSVNGAVTSSYAYDVDGIRNQKTENGTLTNYLTDLNRDYGQVLKETTGTNVTDYTYGDDLISQNRNAAASYYVYDGLGSTRALTDDVGAVTDRYDYEAFGDTLNQTGSTENNYLYTGEQFDSNLDNYYLRARYFNQNSGRFTQQDTYMGVNFDPVTLHKYLYANIDPVNNIDPTGNYSLSSITASLNISGRLSTIASASGRASIQNILVGRASKEAFGLVGEEIINLAKESLLQMLMQNLGGTAATKGTAAHKIFEGLIDDLNGKYDKYGLEIEAEVFRFKDGDDKGVRSKRRQKGSLGIDVEVRNKSTGKTLLAFDLKTGRGASKSRNRKLKGVFGADIIEILVSKKK